MPQATARPLDPATVKAMLNDGRELALIDVREELIFSRNHLLWARSIPLSRLELRFAQLVPHKSTRVVLCDDGDGAVERAALVLGAAGYTDVGFLQGGLAGWEKAGYELFSGVNVPSKAFGEHIEHINHTPSVSPEELNDLLKSGTDMVVVDSRPFDEFQRVSIPSATNVPGAELVLRIHDIAPKPETLVVVNCAGRTRSIIGAQSLINAGLPNKVVALRNGTMGYTLAGFAPDNGKTRRYGELSADALAWAQASADRVGKKFGVMQINREALESFRADVTRTLYVFDVRDPTDYAAGHFPGAINAPGGQLVQATDQYVGTLNARIVLIDDRAVRAIMTASWLKQMGWRDIFVLVAGGNEQARPVAPVLGPAVPSELAIEAHKLSELVSNDHATVVDLSLSPAYRRGHIPGAWYAIRTRLSQALAKIPMNGPLVLTSEDGVLASLAARESKMPAKYLRGGNAAWTKAGLPLSTDPRMADEPLDYWPKPYERSGDTKGAMNEYLSWEVDLLPRIARDGTTKFMP
ncbi:rhodanese-like domain-containing protein [Rhodoplanes sp. Z2-YC6860]|uniref:rhodanese-like domain-containing protein n=1 Tax=Rhodoplanes sp. Z2-YC6860 TaxID=674703 RepID=UPI00078C59B4|nr:rhodanese-like domain-containing protein [Rhodoplanes sp. Z2-YC6860]AMN39026.1 rhodanese domain-containing protein [Rhodoplanes sp. Z2-YC6860]